MASTDYLVIDVAEQWTPVGTYEASSADAAIRKAALAVGPGTYVAVPARSWQPRTVKVEQRASFAKDAS